MVAGRLAGMFTDKVDRLKDSLFTHGYALVALPKDCIMRPTIASRVRNWLKGCVASKGKVKDKKTGAGTGVVAPIFQAAPNGEWADPSDELRLMGVRGLTLKKIAAANSHLSGEKTVQRTVAFMKKIIFAAFGAQLVAATESLLVSLIDCMRQILHVDSQPTTKTNVTHAKKITREVPGALSVLVAYEADTWVWVVKGSHHEIRRMAETEGYVPKEPMKATKVHIPKNHALVFYQDMVHSGDGYLIENLRLHIYFDVPGIGRPANRTGYLNKLFGEDAVKYFVFE